MKPIGGLVTGTPPAVVGKVHQDVVKVLAQPDLRARFVKEAGITSAD